MTLPWASRVSPSRLGFRDDIQNVGSWVDHRSSYYTHVGLNVDAAHVHGVGPGFSSGNQILGPVGHAGICIGVKGVDRIVRGGGKNHVVRSAGNGKIGNPKGLGVSRGVDLTGE